MIFRYIKFILFVNGIGYLINYFIFPFAYLFRNKIRNNPKGFNKFLWWFLHDGCDYGDKYFLAKYKKGESKWEYFKLAYRWAIRNPTHNFYYSLKHDAGPEVLVHSNTTCHRKGLSDGMWRTIKYKDINDVFKDKHGDYIDYDNSILGKQWYVFTINGTKYFRYSFTKIKYIKWLKKIYVREVKMGYEYNWAIQNHYGLYKADEKAIAEYSAFCLLKNNN